MIGAMPTAHPSPSRWLVYLLRCSDGSLYTGITNDLPKRLKAHATGKASRYTRSRLPVKLAYSEPQKSKSAALKRELAIKRLRRAEKEKLVAKGGYSASTGRPTEIPSKGSRNAAQGPAAHAIGLDDAEFATEADV